MKNNSVYVSLVAGLFCGAFQERRRCPRRTIPGFRFARSATNVWRFLLTLTIAFVSAEAAHAAAPGKATNPLPVSGATGQGTKLSLNWTAGSGATSYNMYLAQAPLSNLPSGAQGSVGNVTSFTTPTLSQATTYYWRVDSVSSGGTTTGDVWSFTTTGSADTTGPSVTIFNPTDGLVISTSSVRVNGSASDSGFGNNGVSKVVLTINGVAVGVNGGSASGSGTTDWDATVTLSSGNNAIVAVAYDTLNNSRSQQINVTYNPPDTTPPTVVFTSPSSNPYTTSNGTLNFAGTATDNVGVTLVTWADNFGDGANASISTSGGVTNWSVSNLSLHTGNNIITVSASDAATNVGKAAITVVYTPAPTATHFSVSAPTTTTAGSAVSVTVSALDSSNNTVPGYSGTVHFTSVPSH